MSDSSISDTDTIGKDEEDAKLIDNKLDSSDGQVLSERTSSSKYTVQDYYDLTVPLIDGKSVQSLNIHSFLRTLADFLLTHSLQLKALQKREIDFSDLSLCKFGNKIEGLVVKSVLPKTTQVQFSGCTRHKVVELCPIFILSMYLFARYHLPDTYDEYDLTVSDFSGTQFLEYKLLNGGNKLRPLSYSQQYKASTKILKIMDEFKPVHLGKILTTQVNSNPYYGTVSEIDPNLKPLASARHRISLTTICKFAGFEDESHYHLERAQAEPPESVVKSIFPFLNDYDFSEKSAKTSFFHLLDYLRRALAQDMVEVKQRFEDNILCDHPIFSSQEFCKFARVPSKEQADGTSERLRLRILPKTDGIEKVQRDEESSSLEKETTKRPYDVTSEDIARDRKRIKHLERVVTEMQQQQSQLTNELRRFVEGHNNKIEDQSKILSKLVNNTEGLSILLTTRNANALTYAQQVLDKNASILDSIQKSRHHEATSPLVCTGNPALAGKQAAGDLTEDARQKAVKQAVLSPKVTSLEELWSDYNQWRAVLRGGNVSIETWISAHTEKEYALFKARSGIVEFLEFEAARRQTSVQDIIDRIQWWSSRETPGLTFEELTGRILAGHYNFSG